MRTEKKMTELILNTARTDSRIRAVYMNGSRANPHAPKDIFQDYDIVYVVTETSSFLDDPAWIDVFGERLLLQEPDRLDKLQGRNVDFSRCYGYLMQFADGNRIDLHIATPDYALAEYGTDSQTVPLLDKDGLLPPLPPPSDRSYWVEKPTWARYHSRCNNFWWVAPYCAKGLWRDELLYAARIMDEIVRDELLLMLSWYVCIGRGSEFSLGKARKYLKNYLPPALWTRLMSTYNQGDAESAWSALLAACGLFEEIAPAVGEAFGFLCDEEEARRSTAFIRHIRTLPRTAEEIYPG